jgi:predicted transcriptional regulator
MKKILNFLFDLKNLNSEILASLLKQDFAREDINKTLNNNNIEL